MRHVLYTADMEPITVVELSPHMEQLLRERGVVRLPAPAQTSYSTCRVSRGAPVREKYDVVNVFAEALIHRGQRHMMLFVDDEETALLLKSAFLPGQRRAVSDVRARGQAEGFIKALQALS